MRKAIEHLRNCDPVLASIIDRVGAYRPKYMDPNFHSLARAIVYQQLSGKVASVIFARLAAAAGDPLRPARLLALSSEELRAIGLSKQKAAYIRDLAAQSRRIAFHRLPSLDDAAVIERLTQVKGIGVWTAQMFLIFALRRPDVFPTLDLGVRAAIKRAYALPALPRPEELERIGAPWRPWRSVASWYLWRSLEIKTPDGEQGL